MRKVVIVSGGSKGLGRAIVQSFLENDNYIISTFSRSRTKFIENLEKNMKDSFYFETLDISNVLRIKEYIKNVRSKFGPVDILINNAGIARDGILALQHQDEIDNMLEINLKGTIALTKSCIREMLPKSWGRIINITSIVGKSGFRGLSVYSLTKAGLDGFTRSLSRELGSRGITVNSIAPGFLETEMSHGLTEQQREQVIRRTPIGRLGYPHDVVPLILFLCSEDASFITGQTIIVDGGASK